jgi:hypothetical protein
MATLDEATRYAFLAERDQRGFRGCLFISNAFVSSRTGRSFRCICINSRHLEKPPRVCAENPRRITLPCRPCRVFTKPWGATRACGCWHRRGTPG